MMKLIDEFRRGWQGISQPSALFSTGFAACCLVLATGARWGLAQIRPDVFFTPYFPAVADHKLWICRPWPYFGFADHVK